MRRTRVVHVVHAFGLGGMERGIVNCVRLASADLEHVILCLTETGAAQEWLPPATRVIEMGKRPGNSVAFIIRLARRLRSLRPDVVHTRNWGGMDGVIAGRLARIKGLVHGEHGWEMDDLHGRNRKRHIARRWITSAIREITCVSRHIERWLVDEVRVRCQVRQIYNGVDTVEFAPGPEREEARRELGISDDEVVIGHVGRLVAVKNHDALLRAFQRLGEDGQVARLVCVGGGPRSIELTKLAGPRVLFTGQRSDVARCLRAFDVFVLPSHNEGISNTILEAMATGLPVIATKVGGNEELIENGCSGKLVSPGDDAALAEAMRFYIRQCAARRDHGRRARRIALDRFGLAAMVRNYEDCWRTCRARD